MYFIRLIKYRRKNFIISVDAIKILAKIQHKFVTKIVSTVGVEWNLVMSLRACIKK